MSDVALAALEPTEGENFEALVAGRAKGSL
jgi:hypothetical protein